MSIGQQDFGAALLNADLPRPPRISDGQGGRADKRFDVYRNNVVVSLSEAMETAFPTVRALVGEEFFRAMAGVAVRAHPPQTPLMAQFGADFPAFLESFPPVAQLPYLADIARIENARRRAYHAADAQGLTANDIAGWAPEVFSTTRFSLVPATTILRSRFPIAAIWAKNNSDAAEVPASGPQDVLISRPDFDPFVDLLPPGAADFLDVLSQGLPLGESVETTPEGFDFPQTLALLLERRILIPQD